MLNPPLVYLMQHCKVPYRVELLKQGKVHRKFIQLSHSKYFVQVYMQVRIAYYILEQLTWKFFGYFEMYLWLKGIACTILPLKGKLE